MQKKHIVLLLIKLLVVNGFVNAQVEINTTTENPKAEFQVISPSSDKGILIPRISTVNMQNITTPPEGLLVYNTDNNTFYYFSTIWKRIGETCSIVQDNDADTKVTVEYTADEDTIRFFANGVEIITHSSAGVNQKNGNLIIPNGTLNIGSAYSLPTIDGTDKYVLCTDGSGTLTWKDPTTLPGLIEGFQSFPLGLGREFQPLQEKVYLTTIIPWSNNTISYITVYLKISGSPTIEVGIYDDTNILSSGTLSPTVNGFAQVTLSPSNLQLTAGKMYRVAIVDKKTTATTVLENPDMTNPLNWTIDAFIDGGIGTFGNLYLPNTIMTHSDNIKKSVWFCLY